MTTPNDVWVRKGWNGSPARAEWPRVVAVSPALGIYNSIFLRFFLPFHLSLPFSRANFFFPRFPPCIILLRESL